MAARTYFFAGGGSGGHLFPGIALAEELCRRDPQSRIHFLGSERAIENTILASTPFAHHALPVEPLSKLRKTPFQFLRRNWSAWSNTQKLFVEHSPDWVIGLGGFISVPAVWSAHRRRVPILLLEQNAISGAATRWLAKTATHITLSFDQARQRLPQQVPVVFTGNPLRSNLVQAAKTVTKSQAHRTLLILGGSQGAESLNHAVSQALGQVRGLLSGWRVVHQAGAGRVADLDSEYRRQQIPAFVAEFFPNMAEQYAAADLVISRSGATTLAEIACFGCPALLVPYPFAADQHQRANAQVFVDRDAAVMVEQSRNPHETARKLCSSLSLLLTDCVRRDVMCQAAKALARPNAAQQVADLLLPISPDLSLRYDSAASPTFAPWTAHRQEYVS